MMDIRTFGAAPLRRAVPGSGGSGPGPVAAPPRVRQAFPPPVPVTVTMLPSDQAARSAERGAQQGYAAARDAMND